MRTIAVLITCFNRKEKTLACLRSLAKQELPENHRLKVYLVDDGCTDGTGDAVKAQYPETRVIQGTGSLYWAGGMRLAWSEAAKEDPDYFLLFNDDTEVVSHAVSTLILTSQMQDDRSIAVAAIAKPGSTQLNYGAYITGQEGVITCSEIQTKCDTFNGNCVLIPRAVTKIVGLLDPAYTHAMADSDYGLRARSQGVRIVQPAGILGWCELNPKAKTWLDPSLPRIKRLILSQQPTALPWRDWLHYCRKHHPFPLWVRHFLSPYIKALLGK